MMHQEFSWLEGSGEDKDAEQIESVLQRLNPSWLETLNATGRPRDDLVELILQLGKQPKAVFDSGFKKESVNLADSSAACDRSHIEKFLQDTNFDWRKRMRTKSTKKFCIPDTLHRVSMVTKGEDNPSVISVNVRIGRSLPSGILPQMCPWIGGAKALEIADSSGRSRQSISLAKKSILIVGRPGVGKTTILREIASRLSGNGSGPELSTVVVDKINELAGENEVPHPCIGEAQWMPCDTPDQQASMLREALQNSAPDVVMADDVQEPLEVESARTIAGRGVRLVMSTLGSSVMDILSCETRHILLGGVKQSSMSAERVASPLFDVVVEVLQRDRWILHPSAKDSVDKILRGDAADAIELRPGFACAFKAVPSAEALEYSAASTESLPKASSTGGGGKAASLPSGPSSSVSKSPTPAEAPSTPDSPFTAGQSLKATAASPGGNAASRAGFKGVSEEIQYDVGDSPLSALAKKESGTIRRYTDAKSQASLRAKFKKVNESTEKGMRAANSKTSMTATGRKIQDRYEVYHGSDKPVVERNDAQTQALLHPRMLDVTAKMSDAIVAYYKARGIHTGIVGNWETIFKEIDEDASGRINFAELNEAMTNKLDARISRFELRALWRCLDADGSGEVTLKEFVDSMYRLRCASWPDLTRFKVKKIVRAIAEASEKWHRCSGNWFKIFNAMKPNSCHDGGMGFEEFRHGLFGSFPALEIPPEKISEDEFKGLWKLIDSNFSQKISAKEFMVFMRKENPEAAAAELTEYSRKKRGLGEKKRDVQAELAAVETPEMEDVTDIALRLAALLQAWLAMRGIGSGVVRSDSPSLRLWDRLFQFLDSDKSGQLNFEEFETACINELHTEGDIDHEELKAFWVAIDQERDGCVTEKLFVSRVYLIMVEGCPVLEDKRVKEMVGRMNRSADYWHRAQGNWYKVFKACDSDGSGEHDFEEFVDFIRGSFPRLAIPAKELSYDDLRGLWRVCDQDFDGFVSFKEFTRFMHVHAPNLTKLTSYSKMMRGIEVEPRKAVEQVYLPDDQLQQLAARLDDFYVQYWAGRGMHHNMQGNWEKFFRDVDRNNSGRLDFDELYDYVTDNFRGLKPCGPDEICTGVTRKDLCGLWHKIDSDGSGEVTLEEWKLGLYILEVLSWPDADTKSLTKVVDVINRAAAKWHNASGNWYRIFRLCDSTQCGEVSFSEFKALCYHTYPDFNISPKVLPEEKLKALWKVMDADLSGRVSKTEFMIFMREHGSVQFHVSPIGKKTKSTETEEAILLAGEWMALCDAINASRKDKEDFQHAFRRNGQDNWDGFFTEWDMQFAIREVLGVGEREVSDDAVHAIWTKLERPDGCDKPRIESLLDIPNMSPEEFDVKLDDGMLDATWETPTTTPTNSMSRSPKGFGT